MRLNFTKKLKIFVITVLVLLVAGMTLLGVLGFNQTVDNKKSYEMQVSVDQIVGNSVDILKSSSVEALESVYGSSMGNCSVQELNSGATIVYKFNFDVTGEISTIKTTIQTALDASDVKGVNAEVKVFENLGSYPRETIGWTALSLGIALVVICIYAFIMNKLSGGVSVLCSSVLSVLLFTALMAITRIPTEPYFVILASVTAIISSALALVFTTRYKAIIKNDEKSTPLEVCEGVNKSLFSVLISFAGLVLLTAIIVSVTCGLSSLYLGLAIIVAGIASIGSAVYMTPLIWSLIKSKKK